MQLVVFFKSHSPKVRGLPVVLRVKQQAAAVVDAVERRVRGVVEQWEAHREAEHLLYGAVVAASRQTRRPLANRGRPDGRPANMSLLLPMGVTGQVISFNSDISIYAWNQWWRYFFPANSWRCKVFFWNGCLHGNYWSGAQFTRVSHINEFR